MNTTAVAIDHEMKQSYLDYAMSVIIGRAIPDVRDGLKPVHRRILFAMHEAGNFHNRPYKKSARIVGDVIGKYHPHGDSAVYDSIVRMAQTFSLRYPMVDGQGNFGSVDGDRAAAMRYTEIRMMRIAEDMLADIEKETVDHTPNYDETIKEPLVLPTRIPGLLLNGSSGIAVGMATSIPPHNLGELVDALIALIDNPNITLEEVMKIIPGPDFPTGGIIFSGGEIEKGYATGRGILKIRGRLHTEEEKNRQKLIVTELPYVVNKADLIAKIAMLVHEKKIEGISNIRDESDKDGMRVVIDLKRGGEPSVVENRLYKLTNLQTSFSMNMLSIHNGSPRLMGIIGIMRAFMDFREEVVTRRSNFELKKALARVHILEGLLKALDHIDEVVSIIRASSTPRDARDNLIKRFDFSEIQAQAILDMKLQRLTGLEREKLENEHRELLKEIMRLEKILSDRQELLKVIRAELIDVRDRYADDRRTMIVKQAAGDFQMEDLIPDDKMVITISHKGYIKRTELNKYKTQKRGGVGVRAGVSKDDDFLEHLFLATNHASILYFTNNGRVYHTKVYEVPEQDRTSRGIPVVNLRPVDKQERICAILVVSDINDEDAHVVMVTRKAKTKRVSLKDFSRIMKNGIIAISLDKDDEVVFARLTDGNKKIVVASRSGKAIVYDEGDVRVMGRQAGGVRAIRLENEEDQVVGMDVIGAEDEYVINLTEYGYGKKTSVNMYNVQKRGGAGVYTVRITKKTGDLVGIRVVKKTDDLMVISSSGQIIRFNVTQMRTTRARSAQGVKAIRMNKGEYLVDFTRYVGDEPEE